MEKARIDMSLFESSYWTLRVDTLPTVPLVPEEPEHFIRETSGRIVCSHFDKDKDQIAGRFRLYYADFELAENHQMSAREVLDAYQHTFEYADVILDRNERPFSPRLYKLLDDDIWNFNFLILDRLEILPKYRGRGAGLLLLRSLIERFGSGAGVVGMKPFPLQSEAKQLNDSSWAKRLQLEKLSSDHDASQRKLKLYYRKLGFQEMRGTPVHVLECIMAFAICSGPSV